MQSVFVSYSSADRDRVMNLVAALEARGWSVWWDHELQGGAKFEAEIKSRIESASAVLVVWSRNSVDSGWVKDEAQLGESANKLVPVLIDNVAPPMGLRDRHTIDLSDWEGSRTDPRIEQLAAALATVDSGKSEAAPAPAQRQRFLPVFGPRSAMALYVLAVGVPSLAGLRLYETTLGCAPAQALPAGSLLYSCENTLSNQLLINVAVLVAAAAFVLRGAMASWNMFADLGHDQFYAKQARARHLSGHAIAFILMFLTCFVALAIDMIIFDEGYGAAYRSVSAAYFDPTGAITPAAAASSARELMIDFSLLVVFGVASLYAYLKIRQKSVWGEVLLAGAALLAFAFAFFLLYYGRPALLTQGFEDMRRGYSFALGVMFAGSGAFALLSILLGRIGTRR